VLVVGLGELVEQGLEFGDGGGLDRLGDMTEHPARHRCRR
jgi:hypothetical protein